MERRHLKMKKEEKHKSPAVCVVNDSKSKCCISSRPAKSVRFVRQHCSPAGCDSKSKWASGEIKFWLFSHQEKIGRYGRNIHFLHPGCIFRWSVKHLRRNQTRLSFVFPGIEFLIPSDSNNWMVIAFTIKLLLIPISIRWKLPQQHPQYVIWKTKASWASCR